jgi:hypothetical protein
MTWIWVAVVVALVGLLSWAAYRGRRYGSENTLEQAKADIRRKHGAEGGQNPGG